MTTQIALDTAQSSSEESILDRIIAETRLNPEDEAYGIAKRGVSAFIEELLKPQNDKQPAKKALVDRMIAEIDAKLSQQMDEILHHARFQALESSWRGLKLLVDRTDFRENTKIELINASKQDLLEDFEDSADIVQSGLYKHVYTAEYGQFGGQPVGALISSYYFDPSAPDIKTLQYVATVASMSHAPLHRFGRAQVLRSRELHRAAGHKGPERPLRRSAIRQVASIPGTRRCPLRGIDPTPLSAAHAL